MSKKKDVLNNAVNEAENKENQSIGASDVGRLEDVLNPSDLQPTASHNPGKFVIESGEAPPEMDGAAKKGDGRNVGLTATIKGLKVGDWFRVARIKKEGAKSKRDTSARATVERKGKELGFGLTMGQENEDFDIVRRLK
jgi:hypothetical protein